MNMNVQDNALKDPVANCDILVNADIGCEEIVGDWKLVSIFTRKKTLTEKIDKLLKKTKKLLLLIMMKVNVMMISMKTSKLK